MKYKAAVFDFDLTLADASAGILMCFKHTLGSFGYDIPDDRAIYNTIGMTLIDAFDRLTGIPNNPQSGEMRAVYVKKADEVMIANTHFIDGAIELLVGLRARGIKVGICSTKYRYRIESSFDVQAGCRPVDVIIGGEDVTCAKPDPQGLRLCAERLGVGIDELLYVGDNIIDAQTAQAAGTDFAAVLSGSTTRTQFERLPHRFIAEKISEIAAFIDKE